MEYGLPTQGGERPIIASVGRGDQHKRTRDKEAVNRDVAADSQNKGRQGPQGTIVLSKRQVSTRKAAGKAQRLLSMGGEG